MSNGSPLEVLDRALRGAPSLSARPERSGPLVEAVGTVLVARAPGIRLGELAEVRRGDQLILRAEVVGFRGEDAVLMPLGPLEDAGPDCLVVPTGRPLDLSVSKALLGRVLDGLGQPMDGGPPLPQGERWAVDRPAPDPMTRARIARPLALGIRALDGLCTVGEGQRLGLFSGAGVGKSTLLGQIARAAEADVSVVCLVGERGREVREFLEESLGPRGLERSVAVVATSEQPALVRLRSAFVATAIAEWFRDRGQRVLLLMDSVTRFARAQREVGLAAGEPPARQGYPPSVFALLPRLLERAGAGARGSITAIYTVLVAGGDLEEPIADEVRGILDGHVVLSRALAEAGHFPAVDPLASLSRVMPAVTSEPHRRDASRLRALLAAFADKRDLVALGAYQRGADKTLDQYLDRREAIEGFLRQGPSEKTPLGDTVGWLGRLV
ncbi:MAG: FliI/YscN family ATPase, partial [Polyangia bacterium]|nr:FliI/YscN family ATPase [Polyangia bacterium]